MYSTSRFSLVLSILLNMFWFNEAILTFSLRADILSMKFLLAIGLVKNSYFTNLDETCIWKSRVGSFPLNISQCSISNLRLGQMLCNILFSCMHFLPPPGWHKALRSLLQSSMYLNLALLGMKSVCVLNIFQLCSQVWSHENYLFQVGLINRFWN